jgi:hypothetical protein
MLAKPQTSVVPIGGLIFVEAAAVDDHAGDHLAHVELHFLMSSRQDSVNLLRIVGGGSSGDSCSIPNFSRRRELGDDLAADARSHAVLVGGGIVGGAGDAGVHVGAAELLDGHHLAGRGLDQRRAAEEDRAGAAHDHE